MNAAGVDDRLEERIAALEAHAVAVDGRLHGLEQPPLGRSPRPAPAAGPRPVARPSRPADRPTAVPPPPGARSAGDLLAGRLLAWLGGLATLAGILFFLALAISHGWIGEQSRVLLAAAGSCALIGLGTRLHGLHARAQAATVLVGTGTAGMFATLVVAGEVYRLIPATAALAGCMVLGAFATTLAVRWAGRPIGALGLGGSLLSPVLVGAPSSGSTIAILAVAAACSMWVLARAQWRWLGLGAVLICAPQWIAWMAQGHGLAADGLVLVGFGSLGLAGAVGADLGGADAARRSRSDAALLILNAAVLAVAGYLGLRRIAGDSAGDLWLAGMAGAHAAVALWPRGPAISRGLRQALIAAAAVLADLAFGLAAHGVALELGWAAAAVACAWAARRISRGGVEDALCGAGLAAQLALVAIAALQDARPADLGTGRGGLAAVLAVAALAAGATFCARLSDPAKPSWRDLLDAVGMLALAYLTGYLLDGAALAGAWATEGAILVELARRTRAPAARIGGLALLVGGAVHALLAEAPPVALLVGATDLAAAAIALGTLGAAALLAARACTDWAAARRWLVGAGAVALLYLASIAIITAFQPASASGVVDLAVRQHGQVLLSALWSLVGFAALITGLRRGLGAVRAGALTLLLITVAKVFLYDLATLDSVSRVISFLVLGLLLLAGGFTYQRLRPADSPAVDPGAQAS